MLFALEWCEFCWSLRKMFAHHGIPYRSIDLDSIAYQEDNKGGDIRAAIREQTGLKTIPQIYIGGQHIGGATELFDAAIDGSLEELLRKNTVSWNESADRDPYSFLPQWLHARKRRYPSKKYIPRVSATQAGLRAPSISSLTSDVNSNAPARFRACSTVARARRRDPTGTGA